MMAADSRMVNLAVRVPRSMKHDLAFIAAYEGMDMAVYVRQCLAFRIQQDLRSINDERVFTDEFEEQEAK